MRRSRLILAGEIGRAEATLREAARLHRDQPGTIGAAASSLFLASALSSSRRTAATHVGNIYRKPGVGSRREAAAIAVRRGLV